MVTFDCVKFQLYASGDDQMVVSVNLSIFSDQLVVLRVYFFHFLFSKGDLEVEHFFGAFLDEGLFVQSTDNCESRLIVVHLFGLEHSDVVVKQFRFTTQLRHHRHSCCTSPDHTDRTVDRYF